MKELLNQIRPKYIIIKKSTFFIIITLIVIGFCTYKCFKWLNSDFMGPDVYITSITNEKDSIYIIYNVGGFLGDSHDLIISEKKDERKYIHYNKDSVYVIKDDLPIFYKYYNDTLFLYLNQKIEKPKYFNSGIQIITIDMSEGKHYFELMEIYNKSLKRIECDGKNLIMP